MSSLKIASLLMCVALLIFWPASANSFELKPCGTNTYDTGKGVCNDCLQGLGVTCEECNARTFCNVCKPGYMQLTNDANWTICVPCSLKHGEHCSRCTNEVCTNCSGTFYLSEGRCVDCEN